MILSILCILLFLFILSSTLTTPTKKWDKIVVNKVHTCSFFMSLAKSLKYAVIALCLIKNIYLFLFPLIHPNKFDNLELDYFVDLYKCLIFKDFYTFQIQHHFLWKDFKLYGSCGNIHFFPSHKEDFHHHLNILTIWNLVYCQIGILD